jgi:hypothetical protein
MLFGLQVYATELTTVVLNCFGVRSLIDPLWFARIIKQMKIWIIDKLVQNDLLFLSPDRYLLLTYMHLRLKKVATY